MLSSRPAARFSSTYAAITDCSPARAHLAIWLLETGMVALLLFLLWHPALSVATLRPQQNVVAVLVDNSKSMAIADSGGTREAAAKKALNDGLLKGLGEKFQVRLYEFGKEPERIPNADSLNASRTGHAHRRYAGAHPGGIVVTASRARSCC